MRLLVALLCLAVAACSPQPAVKAGTMPELDGQFEFAALTIVNDSGENLVFDVYLAQSSEQQRRGLMFVRDMPETTGMLFIYADNAVRSIWMKNTYIPLDIVFARDDGGISSIDANATPLTLTSRASSEPVRYVPRAQCGNNQTDEHRPAEPHRLGCPVSRVTAWLRSRRRDS